MAAVWLLAVVRTLAAVWPSAVAQEHASALEWDEASVWAWLRSHSW